MPSTGSDSSWRPSAHLRPLVVALQVLGSFVFTWPKTLDPPDKNPDQENKTKTQAWLRMTEDQRCKTPNQQPSTQDQFFKTPNQQSSAQDQLPMSRGQLVKTSNQQAKTSEGQSRLSVALLLWAIAAKLLLVAGVLYGMAVKITLSFKDFNKFANMLVYLIRVTAMHTTSITLVTRGRSLCSAVVDLNELVQSECKRLDIVGTVRAGDWPMVIIPSLHLLPVLYFNYHMFPCDSFVCIMQTMILNGTILMGLFMFLVLHSTLNMLSAILSELVKDVQMSIVQSSLECSAVDSTSMNTTNVRKVVHLEMSLRKIRLAKDSAVHFVSPFLCVYLAVTSVSVITNASILLNYPTFFSAVLVYLNVIILVIPCCLAQRYSDKIRHTAEDLRECCPHINDMELKREVWRVSEVVGGVAGVHICGLFNLGHPTVLALAAFIATYLVVMLQV